MLVGSIKRNAILLGAFALATTMLIAGTHLGTKERIYEQQRAAEQRALLEIVPQTLHNNSMLDDQVRIADPAAMLRLRDDGKAYRARLDGAPVAAIIPTIAPDGYSGEIELLVGINTDGSVSGVRVLSHRETPGLGDKVDIKKSDWITGFNGRSLLDPPPQQWKVIKDGGVFDQFTGATITPRAVTTAVLRALQYHQQSAEAIWAKAAEQNTEEDSSNGDTQL